jgi:hypothetical protein
MTSELTIGNFSTNDAAIYSVAVFNPAGSVVSKNASLRLSKYDITDALVGHWKLDETSGMVAANAIAGGSPGNVTGTAGWQAGQIANAFSFDGASYLLADDYPKAKEAIAGSAWVFVPASAIFANAVVFRNAEEDLTISGGEVRTVGQFELRLVYDAGDSSLRPEAAVGIGPNVARATGTAPLTSAAWHHLAFSADGAQLRLYVDGVEASTVDYLAEINLRTFRGSPSGPS